MLFGYREGFVVMGTMIAAVLPPLLIRWLAGEREAYSGFAALFGALLILLYFNLVYQVQERTEFVRRESNPLIPGIRRVMRNRVFDSARLDMGGTQAREKTGMAGQFPAWIQCVYRPDVPR